MKFKKNSGFSLIELMTAVVILGIIFSLAVGQYDAATIRARYSSMKANMRNLQALIELYGGNYGGLYPGKIDQLKNVAINDGYWKAFRNPFSGVDDVVKDVSDINALGDVLPGGVIYGGSQSSSTFVDIFNTPDKSTYVIYGADRNGGILTIQSKAFYISNQ